MQTSLRWVQVRPVSAREQRLHNKRGEGTKTDRKQSGYNREEKRWVAEYPWIRDPAELPDNKKTAFGMLMSTEK